jgi:hypothetical protein
MGWMIAAATAMVKMNTAASLENAIFRVGTEALGCYCRVACRLVLVDGGRRAAGPKFIVVTWSEDKDLNTL